MSLTPSTLFSNRRQLMRRVLVLTGLVICTAIAPGVAQGNEDVDHVKALETALRQWPTAPPTPEQIRAREKMLSTLADRITGPVNLCQALGLQSWPPADNPLGPESAKVISKLRKGLEDRCVRTLRTGLSKGDLSQRMALLALIRQTARAERVALANKP